MRTFKTFALGLIGAAVASASDVESLTGTTFPDFVKENPLVLAECRFCHQTRRNFISATFANFLLQSSQYVPPNLAGSLTLLTFCFPNSAMVVSLPLETPVQMKIANIRVVDIVKHLPPSMRRPLPH
jgi:hypothetical protein